MEPEILDSQEFNRRSAQEAWARRINYTGSANGFIDALAQDAYLQSTLDSWAAEQIRAQGNAIFGVLARPLVFEVRWIAVYSSGDEKFVHVCCIDAPQNACAVWTFFLTEEIYCRLRLKSARSSLQRMAAVAIGELDNATQGLALDLSPQGDMTFCWRAPAVHPLQASENFYQRRAAALEIQDPANARDAQAQVMEDFFFMSSAKTQFFDSDQTPDFERQPLASVRMNHLIDSFYLYRLLVAYRISSPGQITDEVRNGLSSRLTGMLHHRERMDWLRDWLARKISDIGRRVAQIDAAHGGGVVIFFLKGGRALNYWLGTPGEGENDWDTQVVINPFLPQEQWYTLFAKMHDMLLAALAEFQAEFTRLLIDKVPELLAHVTELEGPESMEVDLPDPGDLMDVDTDPRERANCKAELIDIGIPRRDQPGAQEEWNRLSRDGALLTGTDGVIFPARHYYVNEYLTMIREAFLPGGDATKTPKRIKRFVQIFYAQPAAPSEAVLWRTASLPAALAQIEQIEYQGEKELFQLIGAQFVEAYNLRMDHEIRARFDTAFAALIANRPTLRSPMAEVALGADEAHVARIVQIAQLLSEGLAPAVQERSKWLLANAPAFVAHLRALHRYLEPTLAEAGAQLAVSGGFAGLLHSRHLRVDPPGLEPLWRILVKLQYPNGSNHQDLWRRVEPLVRQFAAEYGGDHGLALDVFNAVNVDSHAKTDRSSFNFFFEDSRPLGYRPLCIKIRLVKQDRNQLPPLTAIEGVPVTDLRYQIADYARRAAKVDELGVRQMLNQARRATTIMATQLEVASDE